MKLLSYLKSAYAFAATHKAEIGAVLSYLGANWPALAAFVPTPFGQVLGLAALALAAIAGHKHGSAAKP